MLVKSSIQNRAGWRGYHGWLGGELGFTSLVVASTGGAGTITKARARKRDIDTSESIDNEVDYGSMFSCC